MTSRLRNGSSGDSTPEPFIRACTRFSWFVDLLLDRRPWRTNTSDTSPVETKDSSSDDSYTLTRRPATGIVRFRTIVVVSKVAIPTASLLPSQCAERGGDSRAGLRLFVGHWNFVLNRLSPQSVPNQRLVHPLGRISEARYNHASVCSTSAHHRAPDLTMERPPLAAPKKAQKMALTDFLQDEGANNR